MSAPFKTYHLKQYPFKNTAVFRANMKAYRDGLFLLINQGGTSSGKTFAILQLILIILWENPNWVGTVLGRTFPNLRKGAIRDFRKIMKTGFFSKIIKDFNKSSSTATLYNGSELEFVSHTDGMSARSGKRSLLFANEANGIDYEIFKQQLIRTSDIAFIDFNADEKFWAHDIYFDRDDSKVIYSNFTHNDFVSDRVKEEIRRYKETNWNDWLVYGLGKTGSPTNENPAWWGFNKEIESLDEINAKIAHVRYDSKASIKLSIDQNILPYVTFLILQIYRLDNEGSTEVYEVNVTTEICTTPPNNTISGACQQFKLDFPIHEGGVQYMGDSSLAVGSTLAKSGVTGFSTVKDELSDYISAGYELRPKNPSVILSMEFVNRLMAGYEVSGMRAIFNISPTAVNLIRDFRRQTLNANGKPHKPKKKNKDGKQVEILGHAGDAFRYAMIEVFNKHFNKFSGKRTLMKFGRRRRN